MSERTSYLLPELIEMQRESFSFFLKNGILEEFSKINPIKSSTGDFSLIFYPKKYRLTPPLFNIREAILNGKTYSSKLYIPSKISFSKNVKRFEEEIFQKRPLKRVNLVKEKTCSKLLKTPLKNEKLFK